MSRVLVLFSTNDGQTRRIAERVSVVLGDCGHYAKTLSAEDACAAAEISRHDAVVVGAAIRYGHHARELERFVVSHRDELEARRNAFFSVCLCAGEHHGAKPLAARRYVDEFRKRTGWNPGVVTSFAGAIRFSVYSPVIKLLIRFIMWFNGGETDASRDYEYTDWSAVDRFAHDFGTQIAAQAAA